MGGCQSQLMVRGGEGGVLLAAKEALLIGHRGSEVPCMTNGSTGMDGPAETLS